MWSRIVWIASLPIGWVTIRQTHSEGLGWSVVLGMFLAGIIVGLLFDK